MGSSNASTTMPAADSLTRRAMESTTTPNRRSNKPIMEKRRRARINNCLNELKTLILDAMKKDPARHSKLEKADILEMTVRHLETLQRQQVAMSAAADPTVVNKYRAGFAECANEVSRFLSRVDSLESGAKQRLLNHLSGCVTGVGTGSNGGSAQPATHVAPTVQLHIPNVNSSTKSNPPVAGSPTTASFAGLQILPTRLPNGDIALVLPAGHQTYIRQQHPQTYQGATERKTISLPLKCQNPITIIRSPSPAADRPLALTVHAPQSSSPFSLGTPSSLSPVSSEVSESLRERWTSPSPPLLKPLPLIKKKMHQEYPTSPMSLHHQHEELGIDGKPWRPW